MGGAPGDEGLNTDVNNLLTKLAAGTYKDDQEKLNFIALIHKLTSGGRTNCGYLLKDAKCEKNKAKYYYAAAFALLSRIHLKQTLPIDDINGEVKKLFDKADDHSIKANTKEDDLKIKAKQKKEYVVDGHKKSIVGIEYLTAYNTVTANPNRNSFLLVDDLLEELKKITPAPATTSPEPAPAAAETETAPPAPPAGGRKSRRKRKSRRR